MVGAGAQLRRFPKAPGIKQRLIGSSVAVVLVIVALVVALVAFGAMAVARHD